LGCQACGAALPPDAAWQCPPCQATVTTPSLAEAYALVGALALALALAPAPAPALALALAAHAQKPVAHVVQRCNRGWRRSKSAWNGSAKERARC